MSIHLVAVFKTKKLKHILIEKCLYSTDALLNRNVMLRKYDQNGFIFVTERNTKKYRDFVRIYRTCDNSHIAHDNWFIFVYSA